ncbi:hypothetical protein QFC22_005685 [Naganishia vaughanmartiniae]|uniref:Uncharacterized protein n=1 Tax=Naganishia vaughanmartiniae TaxID=1424756 RepID=A0ACC2WR36_9TREE|nr:hypothetical protein QFC22_005685 [Naganishia vaughanmartiniae]
MEHSTSLPASLTKHMDCLEHPLPRQVSNRANVAQSVILQQRSSHGTDTTETTGTTLWLGAQVLAAYLAETLTFAPTSAEPRRKAVELGGGVGFLAQVLCFQMSIQKLTKYEAHNCSIVVAAMGYQVTTTDIDPPLTQVLRPNIERNASRTNLASITVTELDWCNLPVANEQGIPKAENDVEYALEHGGQQWNQAWDVILTTDTIYHADLLQPLLRWIRILSITSEAANHNDIESLGIQTPTYPPVYVALENRDPNLVAKALALATSYGFITKRISQSRVDKCLAKTGWSWDRSLKPDYDGIQIWKWRYSGPPKA